MQENTFRRAILSRPELKTLARMRLREYRWPMVGAYVLQTVIAAVFAIPVIAWVDILVLPVLTVLMSAFWLQCWKDRKPPVSSVFTDAFTGYGRKLGGMLFAYLKVFLWSLLFIIPGIVEAMSVSMTQYILAEYPLVRATDASRLSSLITKGYKGDIFILLLSFLGWILLSALTFGVLQLLYVGPYMECTMAGMFDELIQNALQEGRITQEMLNGQM